VWLGLEKNISGLARGNKDGVSLKWFHINSVGFNNFEGVICNAEEQLIVQCSVDQT